jgi:arylsulfatase A-like enzyme
MLTSLDNAIGRGLQALREKGLEDNTLIFFISDNGGPEDVNGSTNGPFRGSKGSTFEGGIRSPFLIQWKGNLPAGAVYEQPVIQLDILPTALAAGSIDVPEDAAFDGVNLLPYLTNENKGKPHETLYWRDGLDMAVRGGDWKLVHSPNSRLRRRDNAESMRKAGLEQAMLFNLAKDPGETNDLADSNSEKKQELAATWSKWNSELAEPLWQQRERGKRRAARNTDAAR